MIYGLGTDLTEVERIAKKIANTPGFRELVFSAVEISYCEGKKNKFEHYAARFAAKEAFFKALGTGWLSGTAFNQVQVVNNTDGKPQLELTDETRDVVNALGQFIMHISLSHTKNMATATVILETR